MARYRRVNIDGKSLYKTETRRVAADLLPGTFAAIAGEEFLQASAVEGRLYLMDCAYHEDLGIRDVIPAGHSGVGNYVEEGRELAVLCPAGTYEKDTPITMGSNGMGAIASSDSDNVLGYSQDDAVIATGETDFIRVRFRVGTAAVEGGDGG